MRINWFFLGISLIVIAGIVLLWYKVKKRNRSSTQSVQENRHDLPGRSSAIQRSTLQAKPKLTAALQELLILRKWEEADQETLRIMLKVTNREDEGWLDVESIQNFPLDILQDIDQLWVNSSNGQFGFSIQQDIWKTVAGELDADDRIYKAFSSSVGWHVDKKWLQLEDLNFDISSPIGHLPALAIRQGGLSLVVFA